MGLIPAAAKDEVLQAEILRCRQTASATPDIWWLGQSGFLIQWKGKCLLFDPYLSDSLTKKYADTNKPHVRMSERVIDPALLTMVDVVTSSHNHTDHLDAETLKPILSANPNVEFVIPEANRDFVANRVGCEPYMPVGLNDGVTVEVNGFTITGVPAAHNELERDERGHCKYMGYVVQFGDWCVYHSGDTLWYDGMPELLRTFGVDVAFLPINGNDPARGVAGNLNAAEAAKLGVAIGAGWVVPHHYHLFAFNTEDPAVFEREAKAAGQRFHTMLLGEHWSPTK
ncbi:MAG: MBL fold metallo-hydrolase [Cyclobacteriaceae bacterium]|nr:MBL fold metallo-hydrolase [Cyclobacteriaceae bacterium]